MIFNSQNKTNDHSSSNNNLHVLGLGAKAPITYNLMGHTHSYYIDL